MNRPIVITLLLAFLASGNAFAAADQARQADVAKRGAEVMPFTLGATTHIFTKTGSGGIQRVIAKDGADRTQVRLIRSHLQKIRSQFRKGDYSAPAQIHGNDMPGLTELKAARPGAIGISYKDVENGAELRFRTKSPQLIEALHKWFDAQVSDHGADAMAGHAHMHGGMKMP